ncbi:ankyrin repeat family A protein 2 [Agrilus planipennis]|uniref:Ankyrin repeat family A protein 2 n=1 Tax=Agrilus planipennis TaxID=224129 RepID=A0A1W4WS56_AGRPL|nr:ankyrin repeat family A protein 2 [Agrilus planipennis]
MLKEDSEEASKRNSNPEALPNGIPQESDDIHLPNLINGPKKLSSSSWPDGSRKSAFQPYKQCVRTVLTNLQRGNTQAEPPIPQEKDVTFHTKAGQGEVTEANIKNEQDVDVYDSKGLTALHWAAAYGQIASVQLLVQHGAEIDKMSPDGETPLLLAANGGHHDVVRLLLNYGANVNHADDIGNTALMYAASGNHPHTCNELLLRGADITLTNNCNETAFDLAIAYNSNLVQAVIENYFLTMFE